MLIRRDTDPTRTEIKLEGFAKLPVGWRYGRGGPISSRVLTDAKEMYDALLAVGLSFTDAFPGADGEVLLTAYAGRHYIAITINDAGTFDFRHERSDDELVALEGVGRDKILRALGEAIEEIWPMFASSTHGSSTTFWTDSVTWHSRTQRAA